MDVFQCPRCECRFLYTSELDEHLRDEHPDFHADPKSVEDAFLAASHHRHHAPKPHQD